MNLLGAAITVWFAPEGLVRRPLTANCLPRSERCPRDAESGVTRSDPGKIYPFGVRKNFRRVCHTMKIAPPKKPRENNDTHKTK